MKLETINVQITKCPKPYESIRLGGEWSIEKGDTMQGAMEKAVEVLEMHYAEIVRKQKEGASQPTNEQGKKRLSFDLDCKLLEQVCKRIESGVTLEKVLEYYEPDEKAMKVLKTAVKMNEPSESAGK